MTEEEAIALARAHLAETPFPDPQFRCLVPTPTGLTDAWYFDYRFERIVGKGDLPLYAGAIGFLVRKDRSVQPLSYSMWAELFGK